MVPPRFDVLLVVVQLGPDDQLLVDLPQPLQVEVHDELLNVVEIAPEPVVVIEADVRIAHIIGVPLFPYAAKDALVCSQEGMSVDLVWLHLQGVLAPPQVFRDGRRSDLHTGWVQVRPDTCTFTRIEP